MKNTLFVISVILAIILIAICAGQSLAIENYYDLYNEVCFEKSMLQQIVNNKKESIGLLWNKIHALQQSPDICLRCGNDIDAVRIQSDFPDYSKPMPAIYDCPKCKKNSFLRIGIIDYQCVYCSNIIKLPGAN